ncbi:Hypothetical predicted protein [Cloeon dipterum]|nr:Hypothetical predicted protein [Cloeon dipterum]
MEVSPVKKPTPKIKINNLEEYLEHDYDKMHNKVEELAVETLVEHAPNMPSIVSFALLDLEQFITVVKKLTENEANYATPMHSTMLYLATEAFVLSFAYPPFLCGLFGNGYVNANGYKNFKSLAVGLEAHWETVFEHLQTNIQTVPVPELERRLCTITCIANLLRDLKNRAYGKARALQLPDLTWNATITRIKIKEEIILRKTKTTTVQKQARSCNCKNCSATACPEKSRNIDEAPKRENRTSNNNRSPEERNIKTLLEKRESFSYHKSLQRPYPTPKKVMSLAKDRRYVSTKENIGSRARTPSFSNSDSSTSDTDSSKDSAGKEYFSSPSPSSRSPFKLTISTKKPPKMANVDPVRKLLTGSQPKGSEQSNPTNSLNTSPTSDFDDDAFYGKYKFLSL